MGHQLCDEHGKHVFRCDSLVGFVYSFSGDHYGWSAECVDLRLPITTNIYNSSPQRQQIHPHSFDSNDVAATIISF